MSMERLPTLLKGASDWIGSYWMSMSGTTTGSSTVTIKARPSRVSKDVESIGDHEAKTGASASDSADDSINLVAVAAELVLNLGIALVSSMLLTMLLKRTLKGILPQHHAADSESEVPEKKVYARLQRIRQKLGHMKATATSSSSLQLELTPRELQMADEILDPDDIESSFADIGGLDSVKQELYELAVLPLVRPDLFPAHSKLVQPTKGILLYGKPGTGKTMLAKSLAKESCAIFLPLQLSKILNKYWGESNKLIAATFSLAHKVQPAVIFIDELDTFLKNSNSETAYMDSIKAEFLTLWDGIATHSTSRVLVLGATNKPQQIDSAILRRMPRAFEVPLPNAQGRQAILELLVKDENIDDTVAACLPKLVQRTEGYSGSDLKELCRAAAMVPIQERSAEFARRRVMGEATASASAGGSNSGDDKIRCITEKDFAIGLQKVRRTGEAAHRYGKAQEQEQHNDDDNSNGEVSIDTASLQKFAALLQALSSTAALPTSNKANPSDEIPNV